MTTLYQQLKASGNPQAAVQVIISLLENHPPREVAKMVGISTRWVYKIRHRFKESKGNLASCIQKRGPKSPMPNRTPKHIEALVVDMAKNTNFGPRRLAVVLATSCDIYLSPYTIRNILRRYGVRCRKVKSYNGQRRYAVDFSAFKPLQFWQIDTKHIADQSALPHEAYAAILRNKLPKYQFTAIDVRTRLRFIAYASELTFINGLAFLLLLAYWLRAFGVKDHLFFQTDNGEEFGGQATTRKRKLMQKFIFDHLEISLLNIPPGQKQFNTFVERSHRSDDEEFYALNLAKVTSKASFLKMAQHWILYFNYKRPHFGRNIKGKTPMQALKCCHFAIHPAVGAMPVVLLDTFCLYLHFLWDISSIPWDNSTRYLKLLNETMTYYLFKPFRPITKDIHRANGS